MPAPEIIHQLVAKFEQNREAYRSGKYNEARLRQEFLDKFFEALGWDIYNTSGVAPEYADVIIEDSLDVEGTSKAPDYAFKIGRERKFYVEAKKPAVDIKYDIHPAYQLRRYAWNAHLPLSVLTDFEEFAVYNCKPKPDPRDSAATARDKFYRYTDYIEKWDEIAAIFSRDAVWKGSFDKFAAESKGKKGTTEVDDEFLASIEKWRKLLALNLALRNQSIKDEVQLNFAVQMTIDRLIFLRICEDRGIEPEDQLKTIAAAPAIYPRLVDLFRRADTRYNSGLFHLTPEKNETTLADAFTPSLVIDDKVLKEIITDTYYPCPYIFKEIPVEILGQVYEQFLGKVIRLTPGHTAKVEEKPEVRKAGGVYYTPTYIVDYIVKNTVGKLLEGKKIEQASTLRIVDPACGSGSFLLGAFEYLLEWHYQYYTAHQPEAYARSKNAPIYPVGGGWRLTTAEKKRILTNNLYGVDIDPQAVEVTKLSLLLKVLEEESGQLSLGFERVLPDLGHNIQCGNSLIGWDYFEGQLTIDEEERKRVNPFDWQRAFPQVFSQGGFDAVIGNPPYIRIQAMREWAPSEVDYFKKQYIAASKGNYDIYVIFVENCIKLIHKNGRLGFILPSKFFATDYGEKLRELICNKHLLNQIVDFGHLQIFDQASIYTCLLFLAGSNNTTFNYFKTNIVIELVNPKFKKIPNFVGDQTWVFSDDSSQILIDKIYSSSSLLRDLPSRIGRGSSSGNDKIFILKKIENAYITRQNEHIDIEQEILRIPVFATNFGRYSFNAKDNELIIFPYIVESNSYKLIPEKDLKKNYPKAYKYLLDNKKELEKRSQYQSWYGFSAPRNLEVHSKAQMLVPLLANKGLLCRLPKESSSFCLMASGGFSITIGAENGTSPNFVLGLLNSRLLFWRLKTISNVFRGGWITCTKQYVETLPIHKIDFNNPTDVKQHNDIVAIVERMLALHKRSPATPQEQEQLAREIAATDRQIDTLVYKLYGLTSEEIGIVESFEHKIPSA